MTCGMTWQEFILSGLFKQCVDVDALVVRGDIRLRFACAMDVGVVDIVLWRSSGVGLGV